MKHISGYFSSLALLLFSLGAFAQEQPADTTVAVPKTYRYGIRVGTDLYRLTRSLYDDNYKGLEIVADYRLTRKIYLAGELGNEEKTVDDNQLNFTTNGSYFKVGFDYNAYENWLDMENMLYVGVRYGVSTFSQTLNSYTIYQNTDILDTAASNNYFPDVTVAANQEFTGLSAHWIEVVGGVKAEVFDNVFIGFSVRLKNLISNKKPDNFDNLHIPGFDRTYAGNFGAGFNYTVSYFIPLYKTQAKKAEAAPKE